MGDMRNVLVTGGGRRIGRAIVDRLAAEGWSVAVHYNGSPDDAEEAATEARGRGVRAITIAGDLSDPRQVRGIAAGVVARLGPLTGLINNASLFQDDPTDGPDDEVWNRHMAVHVRAPYLLSRALAAGLAEGAEGAVVNIIDQRVLNPSRHYPSYTLSKMALWDQTQVLARVLAPRVRVNAIGPGPVLPSPRQDHADLERQASHTLLGRIVDPLEIAGAASYLLDARSVTGQMIAVDSGQHLNWAFETDETSPRE